MTAFNFSIIPAINQSGFEKRYSVEIIPVQQVSLYGEDSLRIPSVCPVAAKLFTAVQEPRHRYHVYKQRCQCSAIAV